MIPDGARVEYTGEGMMLSSHRLGQHGTVQSSYTKWSHTFGGPAQVVKVLWDTTKNTQSVFASNVRLVSMEPHWEV
jgi:hypothetical protein